MKQKQYFQVFMSLAVAGAVLGVAGSANASGFALAEQSVKQSGSAIAGGAASAEDATTIFFNPAGMTRLHGNQVAVGGYLISTDSSFSGGAITNPTLSAGGASAIGGSNGGDPGSNTFLPSFYYMHELNERMRVGLGIGVPFGMATEYDSDWIGRYHAIKSSIETVNINPSVAYKINDKLSLGAGVSFMRANAEFTNAVDYSAACLDNTGKWGIVCSLFSLDTPGNPRTDGKAVIQTEDWAYGFNLGLLYELTEETRIGLAYRSHVELELEGTADFTAPVPDTLGVWPYVPSKITEVLADTDASAVMDLPASLSLSLTTRIAPKWDLMTDVTWTQWSSFDELRIKFDNPQKVDSVQPHNHEDTFKVSLGFNYHYNTKWNFRGGIAYDQTPIPNAENRTPRIPGNDRKWLAGGLTYGVSPAMTIDFALVHLFVDETKIDVTDISHGHQLTGAYETDINIISTQVNWQF